MVIDSIVQTLVLSWFCLVGKAYRPKLASAGKSTMEAQVKNPAARLKPFEDPVAFGSVVLPPQSFRS